MQTYASVCVCMHACVCYVLFCSLFYITCCVYTNVYVCVRVCVMFRLFFILYNLLCVHERRLCARVGVCMHVCTGWCELFNGLVEYTMKIFITCDAMCEEWDFIMSWEVSV